MTTRRTIKQAMRRRMRAARMGVARPGRMRVVAATSALQQIPLTTWAAGSALGLSATAVAVAAVLGMQTVVVPQAQSWPQPRSGSAMQGADGDGNPLYGAYPELSMLPPGTSGDGPASARPAASWAGAGIPESVLRAYQRAAGLMPASRPGCHLPVTLLAAIGKVESNHAGGGDVDARGTTRTPILGPPLDGTNGRAAIRGDNGDWVRAVGPMQFLPSTWASWGTDGNNDRTADPSNIFDASAAAGQYLCAAGGDVATPDGLSRAILAYNHSDSYLALVLAWMRAYAGGVTPVMDMVAGTRSAPGNGRPSPEPPPGGTDGRPAPPPAAPPENPPPPSSSPSPSPQPSPPPPGGGPLPMPGAGEPAIPPAPPPQPSPEAAQYSRALVLLRSAAVRDGTA